MKSSLVIVVVLGIIIAQSLEVLGCDGGRRRGGGGGSRKCFAQICSGNPTNEMRSDSQGDGAYSARRENGPHRGYDIVCSVGASVYAPFPARVIRESRPYGPDRRHWGAVYNTGIFMEGTGSWTGYKVKMFYMSMRVGTGDSVSAGDEVGTMTDRAAVSPGMINHVHVELKKDDVTVDPAPYIC